MLKLDQLVIFLFTLAPRRVLVARKGNNALAGPVRSPRPRVSGTPESTRRFTQTFFCGEILTGNRVAKIAESRQRNPPVGTDRGTGRGRVGLGRARGAGEQPLSVDHLVGGPALGPPPPRLSERAQGRSRTNHHRAAQRDHPPGRLPAHLHPEEQAAPRRCPVGPLWPLRWRRGAGDPDRPGDPFVAAHRQLRADRARLPPAPPGAPGPAVEAGVTPRPQPAWSNRHRSSTWDRAGVASSSNQAATELRRAPGPTGKGRYSHRSMPNGERPEKAGVRVSPPVVVRASATAGTMSASPVSASAEPGRRTWRRDGSRCATMRSSPGGWSVGMTAPLFRHGASPPGRAPPRRTQPWRLGQLKPDCATSTRGVGRARRSSANRAPPSAGRAHGPRPSPPGRPVGRGHRRVRYPARRRIGRAA